MNSMSNQLPISAESASKYFCNWSVYLYFRCHPLVHVTAASFWDYCDSLLTGLLSLSCPTVTPDPVFILPRDTLPEPVSDSDTASHEPFAERTEPVSSWGPGEPVSSLPRGGAPGIPGNVHTSPARRLLSGHRLLPHRDLSREQTGAEWELGLLQSFSGPIRSRGTLVGW